MVTIRLHSNPISEAQIEKRKELEKKLQQDIEQYEMLKASLAFTNDATKRITTMLNSFDARLSKLETYIMPIHSSTQVLTRTNNNLETAIGLVTEYTNVVGAINYHETVVSKGVNSTTLELYLASVKKLKDALHQLEASKYKSSERITQDLRGKLSKGVQELDDLFQKTLQASCEQISDSDKQEARLSFGSQLSQLQLLAQVLSESLEQIGPVTGFLKIYANIKSQFLTTCLAQVNAAAKDQEVKMGYSREVYQRGSSLSIPYAQYLIQLLQAEHQASLEVIPKHHIVTTFANTITAPIDGFLEICDALLSRVRKSIQRRELNDLYVLIDVWEGLSNLFSTQGALMAVCGKKGHDIELFMANAAITVLTYFKDFYEESRSDSEKKQTPLSMDGTVHENTSTTMNTVKKICEYSDSIQVMIESPQSSNLSFPATTVKEYTNKILDLLLVDIEVKAKNYKKPVLAYLFILNNAHYIYKSVKGTFLNDIVDSQTMDKIDKIIKKQLDNYRSTWVPLIEHLMDNTKISDAKIQTQLTKQQRETIKEKFKGFNTDFEEAYTTQKSYAIPDVELRAQVIKEVRQILCPMFNRFYDRYTTNVEFTKNVDKYIKYNKEELSAMLDKFFDNSA